MSNHSNIIRRPISPFSSHKMFIKNSSFNRLWKIAMILMLMVFAFNKTFATHGSGMAITWKIDPADPSGLTVDFYVKSNWRYISSWFPSGSNTQIGETLINAWGESISFGDGMGEQFIFVLEEWDGGTTNSDTDVATSTFKHTYATPGIYTMGYDNCCRLSSLLDGNADVDRISKQPSI